MIAMDNFQCHKHTLQKTYRLGKPWRPLHHPPLSSSSPQSGGHLCYFEFYWQTIHSYYNLPDDDDDDDETTPIHPHLIKTSQESEGAVSSPVDRLGFLKDDSYARCVLDSLIPNSNSKASDFEADWIVSNARLVLQAHPDCETLLISSELVRCHLCFEGLLVRSVMDQSFEEEVVMKPASKSSLRLLKSVDFDINHDKSLPCVVCQEELFSGKEKRILDMPCKHIMHPSVAPKQPLLSDLWL